MDEKFKSTMQRKVMLVLSALFLTYVFFLVPDQVLDLVMNKWESYEKVMARLCGAGALIAVPSIVIFVTDPLRNWSFLRGTRLFTALWPSRLACENLGCTESEAADLWFRFFGSWGCESSPSELRDRLRRNYETTYGVRTIQNLHLLGWCLSLISVLTIAANYFLFDVYSGESARASSVVHAALLLGYLACAIGIPLTNSTSDSPTGCWRDLKKEMDLQGEVFKRYVLNSADGSLPKANKILDGLRTDWGC